MKSSMVPSSSSSSSVHGNKSVLLKAMEIFLFLVFAGWIVMWIIVPTNTFRYNWRPKLQNNTDSTYFGTQGAVLLIYSFPMMFMSVVSCIYLHLRNKKGNQESGKHNLRLSALERPVLVNGPLGIVSGTELAFVLMFLALIIWSYWAILNASFRHIKLHDSEKMWQAKLDQAAVRLGVMGHLVCAFLFFPVTRASSILPVFGLTSESSIKYHIWLGNLVMVIFTVHGLLYIIYFAVTHKMNELVKWSNTGVATPAGEIALLLGFAMWATSIARVRRKMFELFFYTHQLYVPFFFFFTLHVGIRYFFMLMPGVYLFIIDRYLRFLQSRTKVRLVSARLLPSQGIELNFSKNPGFTYNPLSVIFINVPSVSLLQWHPYTVSSNSSLEPERLSVIIKKEGSWTQKLYTALSAPGLDRLAVSVEGPYSPTSVKFLRYGSLVMVSGGSGITPFISIIREFIHQSKTRNVQTPNLLLICAFKSSMDLTMLDLLLPISGDVADLSLLNLRIQAYVTREKEAPVNNSQQFIRAICFKPKQSDAPIAPVLGPNSWLSLAAIISSSFVAFLLLIAILQHYYLYPIDKNTTLIYSWSRMAILKLLFMCFCIVIASTVVFLISKRNNMKDSKQIQSVDLQSSMSTPSSWFYTGDREMESLPQESLVKSTTVHYEGRPNLKKILLEIEDENVGVMASGPRDMRREVALVCGSGLADNLHHESISFNW